MPPSTRRAALAVCAALLLVTAGCSGGTNPTSTGTTDSTATTTTPTTTATATWSPNTSVGQYPPGVADNGTLANATTLLDAHFAATANQSMELRVESSIDNSVRTLTHGPNPAPYYSTYNHTNAGTRVTEEFYGTDSHGYGRVTFDNQTHIPVVQNVTAESYVGAWTEDDPFGPREYVRPLLAGGNYSANGTVERGDRTFVELTTEEDSLETGHITNGTVLVTPEGVVHDVDATAVQDTGENTTRRVDVSMTLDTDVEWTGPPSWMADVPQLSLSIVEDGHAVEIRNTGGAALPANTSLDVYAADEPARGSARGHLRGDANATVTTDARLEPGDALYVTAGADGSASSFALRDEPTRGEYTFGFAGLRSTPGNLSYRLATGIEPYRTE